MSHFSAASFTQKPTRTEALHFTVTAFSTVGYGDKAPKSEVARLVVTGQILTDLVLLGFGVRVFTRAVQLSCQRGTGAAGGNGPPAA